MDGPIKEMDEGKRKEISDYIKRVWSEASKSALRQEVIDDIQDSRDAYEQEPTSEELWDDAINLVLPFLTISIDQLEPRLVASVVAHDRVVTVDDFGELDEDLARDVEDLDNAVLKDDVDIVAAVKDHIHEILLNGQVFLVPYWDFKQGKIREFATDENGEPMRYEEGAEVPPGMIPYGGKLMQEKVVTVHDQARLDTLDTESVFFPDRVDDWEDTPVIYEHYLSWGEYQSKIKRGIKGWVSYSGEELEDLEGKLYTKRPDMGKKLPEGQEMDRGRVSVKAEKLKAELRCLQGHISYDIDGDGIEEKIVCTIEESTGKILYLVDNADLDPLNRKQIRVVRILPRHGTAYGYPLYKRLKMIQEGASDTTNLLLNSCIMQMIPFYFYEEAAGFTQKEIEIYPGAGIKVGDVKRILMNQFAPNAAAFKDILEIYFRLWQYLVTLPDYNMGKEPQPKGSTATGILALLQEASISHDYLSSRLHDQYAEIFRIIHDLCYLNMDPAREAETLGHMLPKRVLSNSYKIRLVATTKSANRHVERMEMQDALAVAEKGVEAGVVVPDEPVRDYLETFKGINVEKWMKGPIAQVCARLRESFKKDKGNGNGPAVQDPFGVVVMEMLKMPPEAIIQAMQAMQVGAKVKDEMTQIVNEVGAQSGLPGQGGTQ